jgi:hypothetical protein
MPKVAWSRAGLTDSCMNIPLSALFSVAEFRIEIPFVIFDSSGTRWRAHYPHGSCAVRSSLVYGLGRAGLGSREDERDVSCKRWCDI